MSKAGCLDIDACDKASRFIRFCDAFNIPVINFVDVPGYLPGTDQEWGGIIRHGAKMLYAYSEATVPKITLTLRKAYGGSYLGMCSKSLGADAVFCWPSTELAVMGPEGAAPIIFRKELAKADNPDELLKQKVAKYREEFANPYRAAANLHVDDVIDPAKTRPKLISALEILIDKVEERPGKKHGIIPT
jgi:acetyl-CoA carboxylase carboxyltransferase component